MLLCWGEGHGSAIHDHANSHCFMKMLQGSLEEVRFAWPEKEGEGLREICRNKLNLNEVCYINGWCPMTKGLSIGRPLPLVFVFVADSIGLHRVENSSHSDTAVSLHLYCPPYDRCSVFNEITGHRSVATVTFWSMYGQRRNKVEQRPVLSDISMPFLQALTMLTRCERGNVKLVLKNEEKRNTGSTFWWQLMNKT